MSNAFYRPKVKISSGSKTLSWARFLCLSSAGVQAAWLTIPKTGDEPEIESISASLDPGTGEEVIFTGQVSKELHSYNYWKYKFEPAAVIALREEIDAASWRSAGSKEIAEDLLDSAETSFEYDLSSWPDVELERFSIPACTIGWALKALEEAVRTAEDIETGRVIAADGTLYLGPLDEIRREAADTVSLESGVNIITGEGNNFTIFALPVGFNQVVSVDDEDMLCVSSRIDIRPGRYRAFLSLEAL